MPTAAGVAAYTGAGGDNVRCGDGPSDDLSTLVGNRVYLNIDIRGPCTLSDGLYVITGALTMGGNASNTLTGSNATLYFACGTRLAANDCPSLQAGGSLSYSGNGKLTITGWSFNPFGIVYARNNSADMTLSGNAAVSRLGGAVYALNSNLTLSGSGSSSDLFTVDNQMVVKSLTMNGNNTLLTVNAGGLSSVFREPNIALIR
jgi:hypothetical protein